MVVRVIMNSIVRSTSSGVLTLVIIAMPLPLNDSQFERLARRTDTVFFFQAEDGIGDLTVTGVQTCALPIYDAPGSQHSPGECLGEPHLRRARKKVVRRVPQPQQGESEKHRVDRGCDQKEQEDRKSTRLNSSHSQISYAVFCLKKKNRSCVRK